MKKRRMSGWVIVTGPPCLICSRKRGTTLPLLAEHVAEADDGERCAAAGGLASERSAPPPASTRPSRWWG